MPHRTKTIAREHYSRLKRDGKLTGTIKSAIGKWETRRSREREAEWLESRPRYCVIPLGEYTARDVAGVVHRVFRQRQNWDEPQANDDLSLRCQTHMATYNHGRYPGGGRARHFDRYTYEPQICSVGVCSPRRLSAYIWGDKYNLTAPRGWHFGRDINGLFLERNRNENELYRFHFDTDDVCHGSKELHQAALRHERVQMQKLQSEAVVRGVKKNGAVIKNARRLGIFVSIVDSIRSGNCHAGTIAWIRRQGLRGRHVKLEVLERIASSNHDPQVQRVINEAKLRAAFELKLGQCLIKDHLQNWK